MMEFLSIVLLVFGVLQIILFFKLWGMTNNVSLINKKLSKGNAVKYIMTGKNDEAYEMLVSELYDQLKEMTSTWNGNYYTEKAGELIESYRKKVQETGHSLPEYMTTPDKFKENYFRVKNL